MLYVNSGEGKIPLISLVAILSISLTVNLPGLAISPIMGRLDQVFPHVSDLEIQLLTILPNIVIIPFILWSGHLSVRYNQMLILATGLGLYMLAGVLYFFASTMAHLILLGCLLGMGCGLVVPIAAGLIGEHFSGQARVKQLGMKSGLSNFMVIIGTVFVGWMAGIEWHLAFLVYLVPVIPLILIPFMSRSYIARHLLTSGSPAAAEAEKARVEREPIAEAAYDTQARRFTPRQTVMMLLGIIAFYALATYATQVVSYYTPFAMQHYHLSTSQVGVATAMFYLSATVAGFMLSYAIALFGRTTNYVAILLCIAGLYITGAFHTYVSFILGTFIMGLGYGIIQPVIYDKTTRLAPTRKKSTQYFSYVLTANYIAIAIVPFIVNLAAGIFDSHSPNFSFWFNGSVMVLVLIWALVKRGSFTFAVRNR